MSAQTLLGQVLPLLDIALPGVMQLVCIQPVPVAHVFLWDSGARASILCATSQQLGDQDDPKQCYYDYKCKMTDAPAAAFEPATSRWLWKWSAETTALPSEVNLPELGS